MVVPLSYQQSFQQKDVVTVSPDFLLFINGDLRVTTCKKCGAQALVGNDVTDISVSLSTNGGSGNASFTIASPRHGRNKYAKNGDYAFGPMSEVEIFMKGRFTVEQEPRYYQVFWGFIESVTEDYSDGVHTLSYSCCDILRWWAVMVVNVHPSAIAQAWNPNEQPGVGLVARYFGENPYSIIYSLTQTMGALQHPDSFVVEKTLQRRSEQPQTSPTAGVGVQPGAVNNPEKTTPTGDVIAERHQDMIFYWQKRFNQIGKAVRIFGMDGIRLTKDDINYRSQINANNRAFMSATPFTDYRVAISDYVSTVTPFPNFSGTSNAVQSDYKSKLDIAKEVAEFIHYEFYMDVTGEVIFKPPFYNLDVRKNIALNIDDKDIISYSISESETNIYTRCDVYGSLVTGVDFANKSRPLGWSMDQKLARQYGMRHKSLTVAWLNDSIACHLYATQWLDMNNAKRVTGSVTIVGRPEVRLGYPIYIASRDAFYYVRSISHNLSVGGTFTTRIDFEGVRRKFKVPHLSLYSGSTLTQQEYNANILKKGEILSQTDGTANAVLTSSTARPERVIVRRNPVTGQSEDAIVKPPSFTQDQAAQAFGLYEFGTSFGTYVYDIRPNTYQIIVNQANIITPIDSGKSDFVGNAQLIPGSGYTYSTVMPVTDESGYDLIGMFPYGRNLRMDPNGNVGFKAVSLTTFQTRFTQAAQNTTGLAAINPTAAALATMALTLSGDGEPTPTELNPPKDKTKLGINQTNFEDKVLLYTAMGRGLPSVKEFGPVTQECICDSSRLGSLGHYLSQF